MNRLRAGYEPAELPLFYSANLKVNPPVAKSLAGRCHFWRATGEILNPQDSCEDLSHGQSSFASIFFWTKTGLDSRRGREPYQLTYEGFKVESALKLVNSPG